MPYKNKKDKQKQAQIWRKNNPDYGREWKEANRDKVNEYARKYRSRPATHSRRIARERVRMAINKGKLIRPLNCSLCLILSTVEAHHPDYNKPLEVLWYCKRCHQKAHLQAYIV